jgi:hypothetical protein
MPIQVTCSGCKATFNVSDKYAGRQGPCPKCKAVITIPKLEAAKKVEEVKIVAPDEVVGGGKTAAGRPVLKPIERQDAKLSPVVAGIVVGILVVMFVAAWFAGPALLAPRPLVLPEERSDAALTSAYSTQWWTAFALRGVGLAIVGLPIIWAGYLALRDDELEPFRGRSLLVRSLICFFVYTASWGVYAFIPADVASSGYAWLYLAPPFFIIGFVTAFYCFDFDVTTAAIHYVAFITVTMMLGMTAGLTMPWSDSPRYRPSPASAGPVVIYGEDGKPIKLNDPTAAPDASASPTPSP